VILLRRRAGSETSAQRRRRLLTEARAALTALSSESKPSDAAAAISSAVRKVVGARLNIRGDGLTAREAEDALVAAGMSGAAERARAILETCDAALYGGLAPERIHSLRDDAGDLIETIDRANGGAA
jgi:Fic family protein